MNVKILQINAEKEKEKMNATGDRYSFVPLEEHKIMGTKVEPSLYESVYEMEREECKNEKEKLNLLEELYCELNTGYKPEGYRGHSLSVSDVVMLGNEAWYCDSFGFEKINGFENFY